MRYASLRDGLQLALCPSVSGGGAVVPDLSGRNNHSRLTNGTASSFTSGPYGTVYRCNITSARDSLNCGAAGFVASDMTMVAWVRKLATTPTPYQNIWVGGRWGTVSGGNEYVMLTQNFLSGTGDAPSFGIFIGGTTYSVQSTLPLTINRFSCVAAIRRADQLEIWLDGILTGTTGSVPTTLLSDSGQVFLLGDANIATDQITNADFDDTRVYSRALTQQELRLVASEPAVGLRPERTSVFFGAQLFNAAWARNSNVIISPVGAA